MALEDFFKKDIFINKNPISKGMDFFRNFVKPPEKTEPFEFKIGEGLTPQQTQAAKQRIFRPTTQVGPEVRPIKTAQFAQDPKAPEFLRRAGREELGRFGQELAIGAVAGPAGKLAAPIGRTVKEAAQPIFEGFKDLSLRTLEALKGKSRVNRQLIKDLSTSGGTSQAERDLINRVLPEYKGKDINVQEFADRVKTELLPLETTGTREGIETAGISAKDPTQDFVPAPRYESVSLPPELRGNIAAYGERVYESPIKTSAGDVHFGGDFDNYFAHTRVEDMAGVNRSSVHQAIIDNRIDAKTGTALLKRSGLDETENTRRVIEIQSDLFQKGRLESATAIEGKYFDKADELAHQKEIAKLQPYQNNWYKRVIREEVKRAADDGKTKLQFPTGETAMKIEGLGSVERWQIPETRANIDLNDLEMGRAIRQEMDVGHQNWVITEVLEDGKFKAVPENIAERALPEFRKSIDDMFEGLKQGKKIPEAVEKDHVAFLRQAEESFDISGKVDTSNPIYRFYEKEVQKFLKQNYDLKKIKDPQGVEWYEITPQKGPVQSLGATTPQGMLAGLGATAGAAAAIPFFGGKKIFVDKEEKEAPTNKVIEAIKHLETRGEGTDARRYAFRRPSGDANLGDAIGMYQVTEGELETYAPLYLGREVPTEEFQNSPELQDQYILAKIDRWRKDYDLSDSEILRAHRGGVNVRQGKHQGYVDEGLKFIKENQ